MPADVSQPILLGSPAATHGPAVVVAPYALLRATSSPYWTPGPGLRAYRATMTRLVRVERALRALTGPLVDELSDVVPRSPDGIRPTVLMIRRDVHNLRALRSHARSVAETLVADCARLADWIRLTEELAELDHDLVTGTPAALAEERAALASACAAEPLRRAAALSGPAVGHGLARAATEGAAPTSHTRRAEPGVLRYVLRATTKTSPWSWYTTVGWGRWDRPGTAFAELDTRQEVLPNHTMVVWLVQAALAVPQLRRATPHRLAIQWSDAPDHVRFRRDVLGPAPRFVDAVEQDVRVRRTPALDVVLHRVRAAGPGGVRPDRLVADLSTMITGPDAEDVARQYLDQLLDQHLLVPVPPLDPQQRAPLPALADWLAGHGLTEPARLMRAAAHQTAVFPGLSAADRGPALARLETLWREAFAVFGRPLPDSGTVLEDVVMPGPARLDATVGPEVRHDLAPLVALAELFDGAAVLRRLVRHRLVAEKGLGGRCRVGDLVLDPAQLRRSAARVPVDGAVAAGVELPPDLVELAALRRRVTALTRDRPVRDGEVTLGPGSTDVLDALPSWMLHRPSSYSWFVQPVPRGSEVGWCVNAVSDGWGRWLSRFLASLGPDLTADVTATVAAALPGRPAQLRPGFGYNANLHPLLDADEIGDDRTRTALSPDGVDAVHDPDTDTVYLQVASTGRRLDVLYLGFLLPSSLPARWLPLYLDLGAAATTMGHLAPREVCRYAGHAVVRRPRLRHRRVVLARRSWHLDPPTVRALCAALRADGPVPARAVAVLAADLDLPAAVFVSSVASSSSTVPGDVRSFRSSPRPQFVDLHSPLHLRCLGRLLARHTGGVRIEEALPVPGADRAVELVVETYRRGTMNDADVV